jgi:hypothetical protein
MRIIFLAFILIFVGMCFLFRKYGKASLENFELIFRSTFFTAILMFLIFTIIFSFFNNQEASILFTHFISMLDKIGN